METSVIISLVALFVSCLTAWLTWFHRGTIKMTQPTTVFFGPDDKGQSKVFLRTLLYSTARRGQLVENLSVKLTRDGQTQAFNVWVYGETKEMARGSGLFVGYEGVTANHHFLLPMSGGDYQFKAGAFALEVYAKLVNVKGLKRLTRLDLTVGEGEELVLLDGQGGLFFDWDPDKQSYHHSLDNRFVGNKLEKALGLRKWGDGPEA